MSISSFRVKHPRPRKLSDPYHDFSPDMLEKILALPDNQLKGHHYLQILGPILPAGTYEESVYFLPGAFRYLIADDDYAGELIPPIIGFVSKNAKQLEKDRILEPARACIRECFDYWTSQFIVVHRRLAGDQRMPKRAYVDHVKNSVNIMVAVEEIVRWERHVDLAEPFVQELADNTSNPLKAAWFLEYARATRGDRVRQPLKNQVIMQLVKDTERLKKAGELVRQHLVSGERSPTYWRDTLKLLNLELP
jgi:hypothetical protein